MAAGRPITRWGRLTVNTPPGGPVGTAFTFSGTCVPNGAEIEIGQAFGPSTIEPPATMTWFAVGFSDAQGNWSIPTSYIGPAGQCVCWARLRHRRRVRGCSAPYTVT